jgi:acetyl esterase/lipase
MPIHTEDLQYDFRMPPAARYPAAVADVNYGSFLKANAPRFDTRAELVGGLGTSSGGHLLLLNALRPRDPRYALHTLPGTDAALAFAIACWPVADPLARYRAVGERGNDRLVEAHHQFWPSEEAMAEGNPQLILERGEPVEKPPALIMQGTADDNLTPPHGGQLRIGVYRGRRLHRFSRIRGTAARLHPARPCGTRRAASAPTDRRFHTPSSAVTRFKGFRRAPVRRCRAG